MLEVDVYFFRFVNLFHKSNVTADNFWIAARNIGIGDFDSSGQYLFGFTQYHLKIIICHTPFHLIIHVGSRVAAVEEKLGVVSSDEVFSNIIKENLEIAGHNFITFNSPDYHMKKVSTFYQDLFKNDSPDQLILALNKLMKVNGKYNIVVQNVFKRLSSLLSLKHQELRRILPEGRAMNVSPPANGQTFNSMTGVFIYYKI